MKDKLLTIKRRFSDKTFNITNNLLMVLLVFIFVWPLWFMIIASVSDATAVGTGRVILWPVDFHLHAYDEMLEYTQFWIGMRNSLFVSVVGTVINLIFGICCAYPLSRKDFMFNKLLLYFFLIPTYVGGGMIPLYLVVRSLGLVDTIWAMIIPGALSYYNALVIRNYFMNSIPKELQESATLDGANAAQYLIKVVLPLSKPVLAVIAMFHFVGHWNDFTSALYYIYDPDLMPIQAVLKNLTMVISPTNVQGVQLDAATLIERTNRAQLLKYSTVIVATAPLLMLYPFVQKHFVKGVMIGSIKG